MRGWILSLLGLAAGGAFMAHAQNLPSIALPAGLTAPVMAAPVPIEPSSQQAVGGRLAGRGWQWQNRYAVIAQMGSGRMPMPIRALTGASVDSHALNALVDVSAGNAGNLSFDGRVQLRWDNDVQGHVRLRRARLVRTGSVTLEGGHDYTGWSFFDMFHPLDPNRTMALRIDPEDWSVSHASPFVRASTALAGGRGVAMLGSQARSLHRVRTNNLFAALRYERPVGQARVSAQWVHEPQWGNRLGASVDVELGQTIWVAEWDVARRRELAQAWGTPTVQTVGAGTYHRVVLGLRHALGGGSQLDLGYHHNQHGLSKASWQRFSASMDEAARQWQQGHPAQLGLLASGSELLRTTALRRHYLFGSYVSGDKLQPFDLTVGAYYGLEDQSGLAFFELKRALVNQWSIRLNGSKNFGGSNSEFGKKPSQINLQLHLKI